MTDTTDIPQLDIVEAAIDALADAPLLEVYRTLLPFDDQMVTAAAVMRALAGGGGGGSSPTDAIFTFAEEAGAGPVFAIVAVDVGGGTISVAGDQSRYFLQAAPFAITGSTGNDGSYQASSPPSYDGGDDVTLITPNSGGLDATVDGNVQAASRYTASFDVPEDGAIEWVYRKTQPGGGWASDPAYLWVGDDDDPSLFMSGETIKAQGSSQWPMHTIDSTASDATANASGFTLYPDGATIRIVILALDTGGSTGRTTVIVHHHFTDAAVAAVKDA